MKKEDADVCQPHSAVVRARDDRAGLDRQRGAGFDVDVALQLVDVVGSPGGGGGDVRTDHDLGRGAGTEAKTDRESAQDQVMLHWYLLGLGKGQEQPGGCP